MYYAMGGYILKIIFNLHLFSWNKEQPILECSILFQNKHIMAEIQLWYLMLHKTDDATELWHFWKLKINDPAPVIPRLL